MAPRSPQFGAGPTRATALVLISGLGVFVPAAWLFTARSFWHAHAPHGYIATERALVIAAVILTALGLAMLEQLLQRAPGRALLARPALVGYAIGVAVIVSAEASLIGGGPFVYPELVLFVVLACVTQAGFGAALVRSSLAADWVGWATIAWNLAGLALLLLLSPQNVYYPAIHFVAPALIGVALLLRSRTTPD